MKNMEKIKLPEIKAEELISIIEDIKWEDYYGFSYNGTDFLLILLDQDDIDSGNGGEMAEFTESTIINGYDIYLFETIPETERKRILFHEILEANLQDQGFKSQAHDIALAEERKYFGDR